MLEFSLAAFAATFTLVVLAEMGDKTQLVAMAFAAKYSAYKVLFAIFLGTLANFAIVIALGEVLIAVVPLDAILFAASLSFVGFGIWTIREDTTKEEKLKASRFGVIATVGLTFFVAELGDKTQLATLSLTVQYQNPIGVLVGATLAMLVADSIGIIVGVVLCKSIPARKIKWLSAIVFVVFGLAGVFEVLSDKIGLGYTAMVLAALAAFSAYALATLGRRHKTPLPKSACKTVV
ncbi:MAG: TMEM165/GDT1 family protein [Candidatus Bathyarchaeota archaeon]|nr:TMEM165/GDT1 family protein [Candidatus Bathyarchaeota archaeon]